MYKTPIMQRTSIKRYEIVQGETIEQKIERIVQNKEPITDGAPIIYTDRKEGVIPGYNIRTDKWEIACDAMDAVTKQKIAKSQGLPAEPTIKNDQEIGKAESTQGTE